MKYLVGYQLLSDKNFINQIIKTKENIEEVYFSWDGIANGRGVGSNETHRTKFEALTKKFSSPFKKREQWQFDLKDFE